MLELELEPEGRLTLGAVAPIFARTRFPLIDRQASPRATDTAGAIHLWPSVFTVAGPKVADSPRATRRILLDVAGATTKTRRELMPRDVAGAIRGRPSCVVTHTTAGATAGIHRAPQWARSPAGWPREPWVGSV